jgi:orotidine-5'-phosphate decarboxylase
MKEFLLSLFVSLNSDVVHPQAIPGFKSMEACEKAAAELTLVYTSQLELHSAQRSAKGMGYKAEVTHTCTAIQK